MKVYNRTLAEIFGLLPWPYRVVVTAGSAFIVFVILYVSYLAFSREQEDTVPVVLKVVGTNDIAGKLDPAIAFDGAGKSAMLFTALTAVDGRMQTDVRLVSSTDACKSWSGIETLFQLKAEELIGPDGVTPVTTGQWRVETPSLVYDAGDKGREWKAYAYKYFWSGDARLARLYSLIVSSTAPAPEGPWTSEEWTFSARPDMPPPPYAGMVKSYLNALDPSLANVYFYARPSVLSVNDVMLMSLTAFVKGKETADRVILLASVDHGRNWKYLGTPLTDKDLPQMGSYTGFAGGGLMMDKDIIYLWVTPSDKDVNAAGTLLIPFDDVLKATVQRNAQNGVVVASKNIPRVSLAPTATGGGFAAYNDQCKTGVITSEFSGVTGQYELMDTRIRPNQK